MKFKKIVGLLVISSLVLILSACGKADNKKEVTMGEMFHSKDEKVYFGIYTPPTNNTTLNKKNTVDKIIVTKDDKLVSYYVYDSHKKVTDLAEKSTSDIIKFAKKADYNSFYKMKEESGDVFESYKYVEPQFRKIEINTDTDDSGNHTQEEGLFIDSPIELQSDEKIKDPDKTDLNHTYTSFGSLIEPTEIKDSKFVGLEKDGYRVITKVGNNVEKLKFDEPDSKYVDYVDGEKKDKKKDK